MCVRKVFQYDILDTVLSAIDVDSVLYESGTVMFLSIIDDVHIIEKLTSPCGSNSASESTSDHSDGDGDWVDVYITTAVAGRSQRNSHEGSGLCDRP